MPEKPRTIGEHYFDEAKIAWALPDGEHEGSGWFKGFKLVKTPRMLLVVDNSEYWPREREPGRYNYASLRIAVYPRPEHLEQFDKSAEILKPGGPAEEFPGAIGSIYVSTTSRPVLSVNYVQSHFKIGSGKYQIPASLAREYAGWRKLALTELVRTAHSRDLKVHFPHKLIPRKPGAEIFAKQLECVAGETNSEVEKTETHTILRKRRSER
ncbi:MAG: hypothetical protein V1644_00110 [Candidatus Micrarchaeota archaeon]